MTRTVSFTPALLPIARRPLERELTSSWMERVAAANLVSLEELLAALRYGVKVPGGLSGVYFH
jgi:hypothetical protein